MAQQVKNVASRTRKSDNPYASWTDPRSGWQYKLLKSWQSDNSKEYARWFVDVHGYGHDLGDEYVYHLVPAVFRASDLVFDTTVWATRQEFLKWVRPHER